MSRETTSNNRLKPLKPGDVAEVRRWDDFSAQDQAAFIAKMPAEVRAQVYRQGGRVSEKQAEEWLHQYCDVEHRVVLWKRKPGEKPIKMRVLINDALNNARVSVAKQLGRSEASLSDLDIISMGMPAPEGYEWVISHERSSGHSSFA